MSGSIFGMARDKHIAQLVFGSNPKEARASVADLGVEFSRAKTYGKKLRVFRATLEESNRLKVIARTRAKHAGVKRALLGSSRIFKTASVKFSSKLKVLKHKGMK